jgi:hypothetical protein
VVDVPDNIAAEIIDNRARGQPVHVPDHKLFGIQVCNCYQVPVFGYGFNPLDKDELELPRTSVVPSIATALKELRRCA